MEAAIKKRLDSIAKSLSKCNQECDPRSGHLYTCNYHNRSRVLAALTIVYNEFCIDSQQTCITHEAIIGGLHDRTKSLSEEILKNQSTNLALKHDLDNIQHSYQEVVYQRNQFRDLSNTRLKENGEIVKLNEAAQNQITALRERIELLIDERDKLLLKVEALTAEREKAGQQVIELVNQRDQLKREITELRQVTMHG